MPEAADPPSTPNKLPVSPCSIVVVVLLVVVVVEVVGVFHVGGGGQVTQPKV